MSSEHIISKQCINMQINQAKTFYKRKTYSLCQLEKAQMCAGYKLINQIVVALNIHPILDLKHKHKCIITFQFVK